MSVHRVSVYLKQPGDVLAHVQSTNGDVWPRDVEERDAAGAVVPLTRIDVELEPTAAEIADGVDGRPVHRKAAVLFNEELEVVGGRVRYRAGRGAGGTIGDRVPDRAPV